MAVLYPNARIGELLARALEANEVPLHWLKTSADKRCLSRTDDRLKLMTMHSSKGLEFPFVAVTGVGCMPNTKADVACESKLLYVAMTRATERLMVTADRHTAFVDRLVA